MACREDFVTRKNLEKVRLQAISWVKQWKVDVIIFIEEVDKHGLLFCFEEVSKRPGRKGVETIRYADVRDDKSEPVLSIDENDGTEPIGDTVGENTVPRTRKNNRTVE